jgi:hypothetical protein
MQEMISGYEASIENMKLNYEHKISESEKERIILTSKIN